MPRDIPVGNGRLLVNFDENYSLCDIYFPHARLGLASLVEPRSLCGDGA